jgi:hypothetical protein
VASPYHYDEDRGGEVLRKDGERRDGFGEITSKGAVLSAVEKEGKGRKGRRGYAGAKSDPERSRQRAGASGRSFGQEDIPREAW